MRFPLAELIRPKDAELISVVGLPYYGMFRRLITSARNVNLVLSVIVMVLPAAPLTKLAAL